MRIFLTGATGYIGGELSRRLAADGHRLTALVRPTSDTRLLEELGVRCRVGDVTDRYSMREPMSGADWVVHAAAVVDFATDPETIRRINVEGCENVASLAFKLGVGRVLAISSMAAFGGSPDDGSAVDETYRPGAPPPSLYSATKRAGDEAFAAWAERGLRLNTVYPSLVYGPPTRKGGANRLLFRLAKGRYPVLAGADRIARWIHVADLVDGMARLMERAPAGESYLMTGHPMTVDELARRIHALGGARAPRLRLPVGALAAATAVVEPLYRLRGRRPPLVRDEVASLARNWNFDDAKARSALDWQPRTVDEGLPETVAGLLA